MGCIFIKFGAESIKFYLQRKGTTWYIINKELYYITGLSRSRFFYEKILLYLIFKCLVKKLIVWDVLFQVAYQMYNRCLFLSLIWTYQDWIKRVVLAKGTLSCVPTCSFTEWSFLKAFWNFSVEFTRTPGVTLG